MLVIGGRSVVLLLARGRSRGLMLHEDFKDRAKAKSRHLARRGR